MYTLLNPIVNCGITTSSNGNIFRVTSPLCGEFTGHRLIPLTKASDTELWCFVWSASAWTLSKQPPSRPIWRHSNGMKLLIPALNIYFATKVLNPCGEFSVSTWPCEDTEVHAKRRTIVNQIDRQTRVHSQSSETHKRGPLATKWLSSCHNSYYIVWSWTDILVEKHAMEQLKMMKAPTCG